MSALAVKLMGNNFYGRMIEGLDCHTEEWIKRMQEMFNEAVRNNPWMLCHVPDYFEIEEMCNEAVEEYPLQLKYVPDHF